MALSIEDQIAEALADVLQGGWARYLELEDGTTVRTEWVREGDITWLRATNAETGHQVNLQVHVTVEPYGPPPIGPEDDGALRDEIAAGASPDHPFEVGAGGTGMACTAMVTLPDGTGDQCGLPASAHVRRWDPDNPGCAPEECGGSRLDPCALVMLTQGAVHDGESVPESASQPTTWGALCEGDRAIGDDGRPYRVIMVNEGIGPSQGKVFVTLDLGGMIDRTYPMDPAGPVRVIRGAVGRAAQALADGGLNPQTVRS